MTKVLVTGATGYIGGRLVPELLERGHDVRCLVRSPDKLRDVEWFDRVEICEGDLGNADSLKKAFEGVDAAYYLVHSMGDAAKGKFADQDRRIAIAFRNEAAKAELKQIIYLGGLGKDDDDLSPHLRSRHEVGELLAAGPVPVTELRAAIIIGSGSASFEMLRSLVEVLPVMVTPRWVRTKCQPIAVRDVLFYLTDALCRSETFDRVIEIGGPDVMSYQQMMQIYAKHRKLRGRWLIPVPVLTPKLSSFWVGFVTPLPAGLAKPLVEGLSNEVLVNDDSAQRLMPHDCLPYEEAIDLAMARMRDLEVITSWAGASIGGRAPEDPTHVDPEWSGGTVFDDTRSVDVDASAHAVYRSVCGVGGQRGWLVADKLWSARGWIDKALGGVGMRRGRRHPDELRLGDALDFWRVDSLVVDTLVRLRAEMKLPGKAWLEWTISSNDDGTTKLVQRARFEPRGLWGRAYWYSLLPFHGIIFAGLAQALARRAVELQSRD